MDVSLSNLMQECLGAQAEMICIHGIVKTWKRFLLGYVVREAVPNPGKEGERGAWSSTSAPVSRRRRQQTAAGLDEEVNEHAFFFFFGARVPG